MEFVDESSIEKHREKIRHSTAHIMADVVTKIYPKTKLAIGPPTKDGFYYDFQVETPITDESLEKIETEMIKVMKQDLKFEYTEYSRSEILDMHKDEPFKLDVIKDIAEDVPISTYKHGDFEDLCGGPHVESTGMIPAFKLLSVAGAYWRGKEDQPMLQRIYGTAFESNEALDEHLKKIEEANRRDHRNLAKQLDLFSYQDELGPGLIVWHPKGSKLRSTIEDFWKKEHIRYNYDLIYTPHIGKSTLWETSGHLDFYKENMYPVMDLDGQEYYLKPMNCPFHIMYYRNDIRSYRDLPIRIGELGSVYRNERAGVLHGLLRVRGMTQDDAHIFCRPDQIEDEINKVLDLTFHLMKTFGFENFEIMLSTKPEKSVGEIARWDLAIESLKNTLISRGLTYQIDEGGGAFYGPKIDINIEDAIGRLWQCTTVQFDFNLPERFGLNYIGEDGNAHQPYMIHRALLGSLERFIGVLTEHYGGAFPLWLSPIQVSIIPIADRHIDYANNLASKLGASEFRVDVNTKKERMNAKIRSAQMSKIPYMLIIGDKEVESNNISIRHRSGEDLGVMSFDDLLNKLHLDRDLLK
ncbi:MAG: threonine--tRNA ligase [SAR202 cluster bacterium]|nr:threonine--tRNA ligase [SAR202 cluster bacterium]